MTVLSGSKGQLLYDGTLVAPCSFWELTVSRETLESTTLADYDATLVSGRRSGSGRATLFFTSSACAGLGLLEEILDNAAAEKTVTFVLDKDNAEQLEETAHIIDVSAAVSVGNAAVCSVSFEVSE